MNYSLAIQLVARIYDYENECQPGMTIEAERMAICVKFVMSKIRVEKLFSS